MAKNKMQVEGSDVLLNDESGETSQALMANCAEDTWLTNRYCRDGVENFHEDN